MRAFGRILGRILSVLVIVGVGLWVFGPYEPAPLTAEFDEAKLKIGVPKWFAAQEVRFDDITPGVEKRVVWAGEAGARTPVVLLYVHGFSATSEEIRPVPDRVAEELGANLVYTRLTGHGRGGGAMEEASVAAWMSDMAEGLAAARAVGDRVVIMSTSTGGTLSAAAAVDPELSRNVAAMIFVSPNFGINDPAARVLTWPAARYWLSYVVGERRSFEPANEGQATYWTTEYATTAVLPVAAVVKAVFGADLSKAKMPALFWFSDDDKVVRADRTREVAARWGGTAEIRNVTMGPGDDLYAHVIAGDILSPGQTGAAVAGMLGWLAAQGIE